MEIKNNFISFVFLGSFNPGILSKNFLEKNNIFESEVEPTDVNITPIFRSINFKNLKILVDLERFQITEENIPDFSKNIVLSVAYKYIDILKYTPLRVSGINLNFDVKITDLNQFIKLIEPKRIIKLFNTQSIVVENNSIVTMEEEKINFWNFIMDFDSEKVLQLRFNRLTSDNFRVNYNYEVKNLENSLKNIYYIRENFTGILKNFNEIIEELFKN